MWPVGSRSLGKAPVVVFGPLPGTTGMRPCVLDGAGDGCSPCVGCCVAEPPCSEGAAELWLPAAGADGVLSGIGRSDGLGLVEGCGPGAGESCGGAVGDSAGCCSVAPDWLGIGCA